MIVNGGGGSKLWILNNIWTRANAPTNWSTKNQYKQGNWIRLVYFEIIKDTLSGAMSLEFHPVECNRSVWFMLTVSIRSGSAEGSFFKAKLGTEDRTFILKTVSATQYEIWMNCDKSNWDGFGQVKITRVNSVTSYDTNTSAYLDARPEGVTAIQGGVTGPQGPKGDKGDPGKNGTDATVTWTKLVEVFKANGITLSTGQITANKVYAKEGFYEAT